MDETSISWLIDGVGSRQASAGVGDDKGCGDEAMSADIPRGRRYELIVGFLDCWCRLPFDDDDGSAVDSDRDRAFVFSSPVKK